MSEILHKAQMIRANLDKLGRLPQATDAEFAADFRNTEAALHLLQTAIQALIDVAVRLCGRVGLETPRSSFDVFEKLEQAGRVPTGTAQRYAPIVGFRNRVVHLDDRIDAQIVYRVVTERRQDLLDLLLTVDGSEPTG